jgi:hypothetical protein
LGDLRLSDREIRLLCEPSIWPDQRRLGIPISTSLNRAIESPSHEIVDRQTVGRSIDRPIGN